MIKDAQGQAVSGATSESVALYDQAVRAFNLGYGDAVGPFDAARQASPDFVMAHLGKAWLFAISNDPSFAGQARTLIETAAKLMRESAIAYGITRSSSWRIAPHEYTTLGT